MSAIFRSRPGMILSLFLTLGESLMPAPVQAASFAAHYRTVKVDGLDIFYRDSRS